MTLPTILITNDDGVESPGLLAAAQAVAHLGRVYVAAPRWQQSAAGRSTPPLREWQISEHPRELAGQTHTFYGVVGSPAQAVRWGMLELLPQKPDLVLAGINFGENLGNGVTISGTVGAALEAASLGVLALAVSLETDPIWHYQHSDSIDFSTAEYFTQKFAAWLLTNQVPFAYDVDVLKVDVPNDATPQTAWQLTRQSRQRAYLPVPGRGASKFARRSGPDLNIPPDTDIYVGLVERLVSVTPLSLDLTSRTDFAKLQTWLRTS